MVSFCLVTCFGIVASERVKLDAEVRRRTRALLCLMHRTTCSAIMLWNNGGQRQSTPHCRGSGNECEGFGQHESLIFTPPCI